MLVLSRKPDEDFRFPQLGVVVRVLSVKGRGVRIGIEAPDDVAIIRGEVEPGARHSDDAAHQRKNQLNEIKLGLVLAQRLFESGQHKEGQEALAHSLCALANTESSLSNRHHKKAGDPGKQILLVEDDPNELRLLAGILRLEGYDVSTAQDGEEAIHHLESQPGTPDFVLLDMRMPRRDGPGTIQWIRNRPTLKSLPVFSVSATSPEALGVAIGPDGVDRWFPKPLEPAVLLEHLRLKRTSAV